MAEDDHARPQPYGDCHQHVPALMHDCSERGREHDPPEAHGDNDQNVRKRHACTLARWSRPALSALTTLALAATLASASVLPDGLRLATHEMEVKMFASTLAVSMAASNLCDDILINHDMIADFHDRLHITPADKPAVGDEGSFANQVLLKAIAASGSVKTWCDETYELYGPKGTMIPDLMKR